MREIKFRYYYSDGEYWFDRDFNLTEIENGYPYEVLSDSPLLKKYKLRTRVQFTGLLDKNGKEIYEGDILKHDFSPGRNEIIVCLDENLIGLIKKLRNFRRMNDLNDRFEILGNVWENPELLK